MLISMCLSYWELNPDSHTFKSSACHRATSMALHSNFMQHLLCILLDIFSNPSSGNLQNCLAWMEIKSNIYLFIHHLSFLPHLFIELWPSKTPILCCLKSWLYSPDQEYIPIVWVIYGNHVSFLAFEAWEFLAGILRKSSSIPETQIIKMWNLGKRENTEVKVFAIDIAKAT